MNRGAALTLRCAGRSPRAGCAPLTRSRPGCNYVWSRAHAIAAQITQASACTCLSHHPHGAAPSSRLHAPPRDCTSSTPRIDTAVAPPQLEQHSTGGMAPIYNVRRRLRQLSLASHGAAAQHVRFAPSSGTTCTRPRWVCDASARKRVFGTLQPGQSTRMHPLPSYTQTRRCGRRKSPFRGHRVPNTIARDHLA